MEARKLSDAMVEYSFAVDIRFDYGAFYAIVICSQSKFVMGQHPLTETSVTRNDTPCSEIHSEILSVTDTRTFISLRERLTPPAKGLT
jgi:hypothetical protein